MKGEARYRSLILLRRMLVDFDAGQVGLQRLISDLEALIAVLESEDADPEWIEELRSGWWRFEIVNATAIDDDRELTADEHHEVREASRELQRSVAPMIEGENGRPED